jgi:predicted P-loop ATPase
MAVVLPDASLRVFPLYGIQPADHPDHPPACQCSLGTACKSIGKHPMVRWRHYDENLKGPTGGYGIQTGRFNGIFVIDLDVDVDKGKDGIAALLAIAQGRPIPDTLGVHTPSGGAHFYFRLPPDVYVPSSRSELAPGIDVKGEGGFVVGPDSPHRNGGTYEEVPGPLADPPDWLLALVVKQPKPSKPLATVHRTIDPASPEGVRAIAWAKTYLAGAEPSIEGQDGSGRLFHVACHLMYSALPLDALQELVEEVFNPRCEPPWSVAEIEHKLEDADETFEHPRGLCSPGFLDKLRGHTTDTDAKVPSVLHEYTFEPGMRSSAEITKASFNEIVGDLFAHVAWAGVLMFDTFRDRVAAVDPPMKMDAEITGLSDNDVQLVRAWLEFHGKRLTPNDVRAAIESAARRRPFHPIQDWLKSLTWDEKPRLDRVLPEYFQSPDSPYEQGVGPRWFISLVARAMEPGCQSDCTLILEGEQGIGKTGAFRALMHDPTWYAESSSGVDSKDFYENLRGVWLMGFDELDSLTRASLTRVKTVLTATRDRYRKSYGHLPQDYPRSCGFCGSTNSSQYLNDLTGARRFWPVKVLRPIYVPRIIEDREQIWAEAYVRWRSGEPWHVNTPDLRVLCEVEQEERQEDDAWEDAIARWMNDPTRFSRTAVAVDPTSVFKGVRPFDASQGITIADVLEHAIGKIRGQWSRADAMRVGHILVHLQLKRRQIRVNSIRKWCYYF